MLKIEGKEVIVSKTVLMGKGETATFTAPELLGLNVQLYGRPDFGDGKYEKKPINETTVQVAFPYVESDSVSFDIEELARYQDGKFGLRFAAKPVGKIVLVHVDVYGDRKVNYGTR